MNTSLTDDQKQLESEVTEAVELFRSMMVDPDRSTLEQLTAEILTYGHSAGLIEDRATCIESLVSGKYNFLSIELSEQTVQIQDNIAIVVHLLFAHTHDFEKDPGTVSLKVMQVWQRAIGTWKMLARQAVKVPKA
jgi:hypothetical protein